MPAGPTPEAGTRRRPGRAVAVAAVAFVVLLVGLPAAGGVLLHRALSPDNLRPLSRAGADAQCASWVEQRWQGPRPRLTDTRVEDAEGRPGWIVTGTLTAG